MALYKYCMYYYDVSQYFFNTGILTNLQIASGIGVETWILTTTVTLTPT